MEEELATTPVFLPGKFHGQRSLVGYSLGGLKNSDTTEHTHTFTHTHTHTHTHTLPCVENDIHICRDIGKQRLHKLFKVIDNSGAANFGRFSQMGNLQHSS